MKNKRNKILIKDFKIKLWIKFKNHFKDLIDEIHMNYL